MAFPALNEEATIGKAIGIIKAELYDRCPLLDEIVVIDSGSTDRTREASLEAGARVFKCAEILPELGHFPGKGENLWKSLSVLDGDLIVWLDADIKNMDPKFVYGLVGPLLKFDQLLFVKAFYQRPLQIPGEENEYGGGRVTEILVRPLLSLFFPDLARFYQPCSGECAGRRELFDHLPFPCGYGIETGMLIDIYTRFGREVMAQTDLNLRIHRNQPASALGKMGFEILHAFLKRAEDLGLMDLAEELNRTYQKLETGPDFYSLKEERVQIHERPPMREIEEYRIKRLKYGIGEPRESLADENLI